MNEEQKKEFEQKYGELHSPYVDCEIYQSDILNWFEYILIDEINKERQRIYSNAEGERLFTTEDYYIEIDKLKKIIFNQGRFFNS